MEQKFAYSHERFKRDIRDHRMKVFQDQGIIRHIRFSNPKSIAYQFDLITWAGYLCITGDCGTYVFSRTRDMFEFFGGDDSRPTSINPDYWSEKVQAGDRQGGLEQFSASQFVEVVKTHFKEFDFEDDDQRAAYEEHLTEMNWGGDVDDMDGAQHFFTEFNNEIDLIPNPGKEFVIDELWDYGLKEFTFRFIWCCRAIRWGIRQFEMGGDPVDRQAAHDAKVLKGKA